ncbi:MAG: AAA family ATPase, partial [Clostridia bacterium]|nr:AAA family ATPase [Clostridia bacterium]
MNKLFVKSIELKSDEIPSLNEYPFSIDCIKQLERIDFKAAVTFFYGENGTGKSTLLEAIAIALGINAEGGSENFAFSTYDDYSQL